MARLGDAGRLQQLRQTLRAVRRTLDPAAGSRYLASRRSRHPAAYEAAIDPYAGELLPADRYEEWVEESRQRLWVTYLSLLLTFARLWEGRGEYDLAPEVLTAGCDDAAPGIAKI